jgi:gamma-D-glutamyl-L-lysine dipeptidyl-peptidase
LELLVGLSDSFTPVFVSHHQFQVFAGGVCGRGLDCTGLIHGVYRRYGHVIPRDAADMTQLGDPVDLSELQPGDLMFFRKPDTGYVYHAGICVNVIDGWPAMLHASQTDWNTIDTPITALRHSHLDSARRMHSRAWAVREEGELRVFGDG